MTKSDQAEAAAALRSCSRAIQSALTELGDLANRAPDPSEAAAIRAAMERVMAASRDIARALVEVHKG